MASFKIQPCKLRAGWLVPTKDPPLVLNWRELCARLAPSRDLRALQTLQLVQLGSYVGLVIGPNGARTNFVLTNTDRSGNLGVVLTRDPSFESRLVEVYRVEAVKWDARVTEHGLVKGVPR